MNTDIITTLLSHIDSGTPWTEPSLPSGHRVPASIYTDPSRRAEEQKRLFARQPQVLALSADLPEPGSFVTRDHLDMPLVIARHGDGTVRAMANVCAHRGGRVVESDRGCRRRHACSYHGWTYNTGGTLVAVPDQRSFPAVDVPGPGLTPLPAVEADGVIWVYPKIGPDPAAVTPIPTPAAATAAGDRPAAPDLGLIADDFNRFDIGSHRHWRHHRFDLAMNWKLVIDTFLEPYHFASLHRDTVGPIFFPNLCFADRHGPQGQFVRHIVPRRSIVDLADQPPASWDPVPHTALVYALSPATVLVMQIDHIELWRVTPDRHRVDRARCDLDFYIPDGPRTESSERHWEKNWQLTIDTVEHEDFKAMAGVQRGVGSGALDHVRFGANEPALIMYHLGLEAMMNTGSGGSAPLDLDDGR